MYYQAIVGYETDKGKIKKVKYLCEAESQEQASLVMSQFAAESMDNAKVIGVTEASIAEVVDSNNSPKYYKRLQTA
jgi:hypothetical protein